MSSWSRWAPRWTPFSQQQPSYPNEREYVTADQFDRERHRGPTRPTEAYSHYDPTRSHHHQHSREHSRSPPPPRRERRPTAHEADVLIISYRGTMYPMHFSPYSIDDGLLRIGDVRDEASRLIRDLAPSQMKMFVKGKKLEDNTKPCRDAGFRSKVPERILVTEGGGRPINTPATPPEPSRTDGAIEESDGSSDEDDKSGVEGARGGKKRKNRKKKRNRKGASSTTSSSTTSAGASSGPLPYPTGGTEYLPMPSGSHPSHRMPSPASAPVVAGQGQGTSSTSSRPRSPTTSTANSTTTSTTSTSAPPPSGPLATLETIATHFHSTLLPKVQTFLSNPPAEKDKRKQEAGRLSLTIEQNVVLKYDGVEHGGDEVVRSRRKELIKEAQGVLGRLDGAVEG